MMEEIVLHSQLKKEAINLGLVLLALAIIIKIAFFRTDIVATTRTALALFWMFALPGYALLYYWKDRLDFGERIVIGTTTAAAVTAILSYYTGLLGLPVSLHGIVIPVGMLAAAYLIIKRKK